MHLLVTGGVRSGKSLHAEWLLADEPVVRYVAAGPTYDDADWRDRVALHRERRPSHWETLETTDLAPAIAAAPGAVIVECLGTWINAIVDEAALWEAPTDAVSAFVASHLEPVLAAVLAAARPVVLVTNEVGLGVVPEHRSGRLFRDLLGTVNVRVGEVVDEVHLVVAGRVLRL
jgi:adenosylcobinamide kinase/adenosylcobinamide-phosphate guanylyltransferase